MDWGTVISTFIGVVAGGLINGFFSWRASRELKQEAEGLRQLTIKLIRILDGAGLIEVDEWDPVTGEPKSYPQMLRLKEPIQENPPPEDKEAGEESP